MWDRVIQALYTDTALSPHPFSDHRSLRRQRQDLAAVLAHDPPAAGGRAAVGVAGDYLHAQRSTGNDRPAAQLAAAAGTLPTSGL